MFLISDCGEIFRSEASASCEDSFRLEIESRGMEFTVCSSGIAVSRPPPFGYLCLLCVQWPVRLPVAIQLIPVLIVFCLMIFLPEFPCWLIMHGKIDQCIHKLCKPRRLPADDPALKAESSIPSWPHTSLRNLKLYFITMSSFRTESHRICLGFFIQAAQQLSGINLVATHANKILGGGT